MEKFLNKITCGDSYELIKEIPDRSIDCVYTDIPYLFIAGGGGHSDLAKRVINKKQSLETIRNGIDYSILDEFKRVLKKMNLFIWCSKMQLLDIMKWGGAYNSEVLVWCKTNPQPTGNQTWLPDIEYCLYFRESGVRLNDGYALKSKWYISPINQADKVCFDHPTIKPLELVKRHLLHTTQPNDIVADFFCGSGTSCVGAKETGRQFIGIEIEPKWAKVANDRLNNMDAHGQISMFLR